MVTLQEGKPQGRTQAETPGPGVRQIGASNVWPNLFVVGAPRSGTTSLYKYLEMLPDVCMSTVKEPHYFNAALDPRGPLAASLSIVRDEQKYLRLFDHAGPRKVVGEATPTYLWDPVVPSRIKAKVPDAKIVMILREPIERAHSHYLTDVRLGLEPRPFSQALTEDHANADKVLGRAHLYIEQGLYADQVERYLDTFGKKQIRIYLFEDFTCQPSKVMNELCKFLDVMIPDPHMFDAPKRFNTYFEPRNAFFKWIIQTRNKNRLMGALVDAIPVRLREVALEHMILAKAPKPRIEKRAKEYLAAIYYPDVLKLQRLLAQDLSPWLAEAKTAAHA